VKKDTKESRTKFRNSPSQFRVLRSKTRGISFFLFPLRQYFMFCHSSMSLLKSFESSGLDLGLYVVCLEILNLEMDREERDGHVGVICFKKT
jgi:hypothetical protein